MLKLEHKIYIAIAVAALLAATLPWAFVRYIKRTPATQAPARPITTTTAELGTTTTYKAMTFRVYPSEQESGKDVTLSWSAPDAEIVKVLGYEVPAYGSMTTRTPNLYTLTATGPNGSKAAAISNFTTYELEAVLKGSAEPVKLEVKLKLLPPKTLEKVEK